MDETGEKTEEDNSVQPDTALEFGNEPVYDFYCMFCEEDGEHVEAKSYCVNCEEYMCSACCNYHRKSRMSRHHELLDAEAMPRDTPVSDRADKVITTKCSKHATELVKYYCKNHEELGCATCFALGHRTCSDIESIVDKSEHLLEDNELQDFVNGLDSLNQKSLDVIKQCEENVPKVALCYSEAVAGVKSQRERVNTSFDVLESDIIAQAELLKSGDESKLDQVSRNCRSALDTINTMSSDIQSLQASKRVCEIFIMMMATRKKIQTLKTTLQEAESKTAVKLYTFEPNMKMFEYLAKRNVFGEMSFQQSLLETTRGAERNPQNVKVRHAEDIDVKSNGDKERCLITGSTVLPGNKLVIADFLNDRVKLLNTRSNKILCDFKVMSHPRDVAVIAKDRVAVTLEGVNKVLILAVTDMIKVVDEIATSGECRGVAYANGNLFVTFCRPGRLEVMDLRGRVSMTVKNGIFKCPDYVCLSNDSQTIFVSDYVRCEVKSLNMDGSVKSTYSSSSLNGPQKLCTDERGHVYVCDYRTQSIHVITAESDKVYAFLSEEDGLYSGVFTVSHCRESNRLFVGLDGNIVKAYQLE